MSTPSVKAPSAKAQAKAKAKVQNRTQVRRNTLIGWSFILPNFVGFALLTLIPVIGALALAFMKWNSYSSPEWVGLKNFSRLLGDSNFRTALWNTIYFTIGTVPLTLVCSLGLAVLLNTKLPGMKFFRASMFFPYVTSLVAVAVVWNMLFHPSLGPINQFLTWIGIDNPPGWTSSSAWAMPAIIITSVWRGMGYYMILYLAGLQSIPRELYEAAATDGAGKWKQFVHVTLPSLRPTTFFVLIMLTISSFKVFDLVQIMTDGGPGRSTLVLSQLIYRQGIQKGDFGYSSAISMVLFVIVLVVTIVQFRIQKRNEDG